MRMFWEHRVGAICGHHPACFVQRAVWGSLRSCGDLDATGQLCSLAVASSTVQMLKVSEISTSGALVSWDSVAGATGYRVAWGPTPGKILLSSSLYHPHQLLTKTVRN